jgi:hypothetical protein
MSSPGGLAGLVSPMSGSGDGDAAAAGSARDRGARRRRVFGYLKAANDLRQSYSAQLAQKYQDVYDERIYSSTEIPDVAPVMYGNEEMVLFPTYARRHVKTQPQGHARSELDESVKSEAASHDPEYFQRQLDKQVEDDNAIVDIDVRGWVYAPHQGQLGRKNRILLSLARRLSGVPAPDTDSSGDSDSDPSPSNNTLANKEADAILEDNLDPSSVPPKPDYGLSQTQIVAANAELMERLSPFLTNPLAGLPTTIFFFNDKQSRQGQWAPTVVATSIPG